MEVFEGKVNVSSASRRRLIAFEIRPVADIFISYKREDRSRVAIIADILSDLGLTSWFDASLISGDSWEAVINREVSAASAMLVCWTPQAVASVQVMREVLLGATRRMLAPVFLDKCVLPQGLHSKHVADLSSWDLSLNDPEWLAMLARLETLTGRTGLCDASNARAAGQASAYLMRRILTQAAREQRVLSYAQGVAKLQQALNEAYPGHAPRVNNHFLYGALDATAAENRARRESPLCVSVVNRSGKPGRGYFQKHAFLDDADDPLAEATFERHLERVRSWSWET
jgi:hypothetical protein